MDFYAECSFPEHFGSFLLPGEGSQVEPANQKMVLCSLEMHVMAGEMQTCPSPHPSPESSGRFCLTLMWRQILIYSLVDENNL